MKKLTINLSRWTGKTFEERTISGFDNVTITELGNIYLHFWRPMYDLKIEKSDYSFFGIHAMLESEGK